MHNFLKSNDSQTGVILLPQPPSQGTFINVWRYHWLSLCKEGDNICIKRVDARSVAKYSRMHRTASVTKNYWYNTKTTSNKSKYKQEGLHQTDKFLHSK